MAPLRGESLRPWIFAVLAGAWTALFLVPAPSPWAWAIVPVTMAAAWMLGSRSAVGLSTRFGLRPGASRERGKGAEPVGTSRGVADPAVADPAVISPAVQSHGVATLAESVSTVIGTVLILVSNLVSAVSGMDYGRIELMLPTLAALFALGRAQTRLWLDLLLLAGMIAATQLRTGADLDALPTLFLVYCTPWAFGLIVRRRAHAATAAALESERLGALDIARLANSAAAQERQRVIEDSITTLRHALEQIQARSELAMASPSDARIRSIQEAARTAIDHLHETLGALRAGVGIHRDLANGEALAPRQWWRTQAFDIAVTALATVGMLAAAAPLGSEWHRPVSLVPALVLPVAALFAPRIPLISGLAAAAAMSVAALDSPHPSEALTPMALPFAALCWRLVQGDARRRWVIGIAIGVATAAGIGLSVLHGREGIGFVLLLAALGVIGGLGWADKEAIMQREEARAAKLTAALAAAQIGAVREERRRIARELHDVVSHAIASVSLQAQVARIHLEKQPVASRIALATVLTIARETSCELETIADQLIPADARPALCQLIERGNRLGLRVTAELDPTVEDELVYRIVQEGLTNAARHSPGSEVSVRVALAVSELGQDARVIVVVRNGPADRMGVLAGSGEMPKGSGLGLCGLQERVVARAGEFWAGPMGEGQLRGNVGGVGEAGGTGAEGIGTEGIGDEGSDGRGTGERDELRAAASWSGFELRAEWPLVVGGMTAGDGPIEAKGQDIVPVSTKEGQA